MCGELFGKSLPIILLPITTPKGLHLYLGGETQWAGFLLDLFI
jgi:cellobiose-specific phosphotransferase system component IIC